MLSWNLQSSENVNDARSSGVLFPTQSLPNQWCLISKMVRHSCHSLSLKRWPLLRGRAHWRPSQNTSMRDLLYGHTPDPRISLSPILFSSFFTIVITVRLPSLSPPLAFQILLSPWVAIEVSPLGESSVPHRGSLSWRARGSPNLDSGPLLMELALIHTNERRDFHLQIGSFFD